MLQKKISPNRLSIVLWPKYSYLLYLSLFGKFVLANMFTVASPKCLMLPKTAVISYNVRNALQQYNYVLFEVLVLYLSFSSTPLLFIGTYFTAKIHITSSHLADEYFTTNMSDEFIKYNTWCNMQLFYGPKNKQKRQFLYKNTFLETGNVVFQHFDMKKYVDHLHF